MWQTWLQTFAKANDLYSSGNQLFAMQLVTWNDYEEATEIESGIDNCISISASVSGSTLQWTITGDPSTIDHYVPYASSDGQALMSLGELPVDTGTLDLCNLALSNGSYFFYVQAIGKPSMTIGFRAACRQISPAKAVVARALTLDQEQELDPVEQADPVPPLLCLRPILRP